MNGVYSRTNFFFLKLWKTDIFRVFKTEVYYNGVTRNF